MRLHRSLYIKARHFMNEKLRSQFTPPQPLMAASQNVNRENLGREIHTSKKDTIKLKSSKKKKLPKQRIYLEESAPSAPARQIRYIGVSVANLTPWPKGAVSVTRETPFATQVPNQLLTKGSPPYLQDSKIEDSGSRARSVTWLAGSMADHGQCLKSGGHSDEEGFL